MVCILKKPEKNSPGIIIFTHNEYLFGGFKEPSTHKVIERMRSEWRFGVQIQGDCHFLSSWPDETWVDFILWPNLETPFLHNVRSKIIPFSCIHFYPDMTRFSGSKIFDLCVGSRPAISKNFPYALELVKKVLAIRPQSTIVFLVPDNRVHGIKAYLGKKNKDNYSDKILSYFTAAENRQISFVGASTHTFGFFPLTSELYWHLLSICRTSLLTSFQEGLARIVVESILAQVRPIIMQKLICGVPELFQMPDVVKLDNNQEDVFKIIAAIEAPLDPFTFEERSRYLLKHNWENFTSQICQLSNMNVGSADAWLSHDLSSRLAGHLRKKGFQFLNGDEMALWLKKTEKKEYDMEEMV